MSLISEALKEAQRSHTERLGPKSTSVGEAFFPYPEGKPSRRQPSLAVKIVAGTVSAAIIVAAAIMVRGRLHPVPATSALPPIVMHPAPVVGGGTPARPTGDTATTTSTRPPLVSAPATPAANRNDPSRNPVGHAAGSSKAVANSTDSASDASHASLAAASKPPAVAPPAPSPAVEQQGTSASGVRVVLDGAAGRPGDSLFKQAFAEQSRGNAERAKELYERAIALPQASAETFNDYGVLLLQTGNQLGAAEMFKQALKRDDKNVNAWINLGDSYNAVGHHADAMGAYARASQLDASSTAVKLRMAAEYQAIGDTAVAHRMYDEAVKVAPSDPNVHYNFGKFLQSQRDYRGAVREYQSFVDLAPGKFSPENIATIRQYIVTLSRYVK